MMNNQRVLNKEAAIAKEITPAILKTLGVSKDIIEQLVEPLSSAFVKYGCRNQAAVVQSLQIAAPHLSNMFNKVSDDFFNYLNKELDSRSQLYAYDQDMIKDLVNNTINNEDISIDDKYHYVNDALDNSTARRMQEESSRRDQIFSVLKFTLGLVVGGSTLGGLGCKAFDVYETKVIEDNKTERVYHITHPFGFGKKH